MALIWGCAPTGERHPQWMALQGSKAESETLCSQVLPTWSRVTEDQDLATREGGQLGPKANSHPSPQTQSMRS